MRWCGGVAVNTRNFKDFLCIIARAKSARRCRSATSVALLLESAREERAKRCTVEAGASRCYCPKNRPEIERKSSEIETQVKRSMKSFQRFPFDFRSVSRNFRWVLPGLKWIPAPVLHRESARATRGPEDHLWDPAVSEKPVVHRISFPDEFAPIRCLVRFAAVSFCAQRPASEPACWAAKDDEWGDDLGPACDRRTRAPEKKRAMSTASARGMAAKQGHRNDDKRFLASTVPWRFPKNANHDGTVPNACGQLILFKKRKS